MEIARVSTRLFGPVVPAGVQNDLYFRTTDGHAFTPADALRAMQSARQIWLAVSAILTGELVAAWQDPAQCLEATTGVLTRDVTPTAYPTEVLGTDTNGCARGVGIRIRWTTSTVWYGRFGRGSTWVGPFGDDVFDLDGSPMLVATANLAAGATACTSVARGGGLTQVIYSRPKHLSGRPGTAFDVSGNFVLPRLSLNQRRCF